MNEIPEHDARGNALCPNCGHTRACCDAHEGCPDQTDMEHVCLDEVTRWETPLDLDPTRGGAWPST